MSAGHVRGTRGSGIVSSVADVLWMRVVRGIRGVDGVCEMCWTRGGVGGEEAPSDTSYKRCSCHSGHKLLCKLC